MYREAQDSPFLQTVLSRAAIYSCRGSCRGKDSSAVRPTQRVREVSQGDLRNDLVSVGTAKPPRRPLQAPCKLMGFNQPVNVKGGRSMAKGSGGIRAHEFAFTGLLKSDSLRFGFAIGEA